MTIGIPVKNERGSLADLKIQLIDLLKKEKFSDIKFEILINDNLSSDGSTEFLKLWESTDTRVKVFLLNQPLDFQSTIQDLMTKSKGEAFALFQSDLQDPTDILEKLIEVWLKNPDYIVAGKIVARKGDPIINIGRKLFYWLLAASSDKDYSKGFQDLYVLPRYVYSQIARLPNQGLFIRGYLNYSFSKIIFVGYSRHERKYGESNFNFGSMYDLALDGLLLYGRKFIRILSVGSFILFATSLFSVIILLLMFAFRYDYGVKGWASIALGISALTSFLGMLTGLVLEYLIRIHRRLNLMTKL
jgi:hypothetical protein